jgi:riboflavin kinase / FMN adenylyltransferase
VTVLSWADLLSKPSPFRQPVRLAIGVFDGLHIGHRRLIECILGGPAGSIPLVLTFRAPPAALSGSWSFPGLILTHEQKLERFAAMGVPAAVVIDFSEELSNLSGSDFIALLVKRLAIEKIVVGYNFRFGKGRSAGTDDLKEMLFDTGTEVQITEPVLWGGSRVSSSRIRKTIKDAEFSEAKAMLSAAHCLDLRGLEAGDGGDGFLRIERPAVAQVLPKPGRYPVRCIGEGAEGPGVLTVGTDHLDIAAAGLAGSAGDGGATIRSIIFE